MNFAAATGHRLGRATPCLRDTPQRKWMGTTGRRSTYRRRNAVQANPATSVGAKIVRHGRSITFQMAEVMVPRALFQEILGAIAALRPLPPARC